MSIAKGIATNEEALPSPYFAHPSAVADRCDCLKTRGLINEQTRTKMINGEIGEQLQVHLERVVKGALLAISQYLQSNPETNIVRHSQMPKLLSSDTPFPRVALVDFDTPNYGGMFREGKIAPISSLDGYQALKDLILSTPDLERSLFVNPVPDEDAEFRGFRVNVSMDFLCDSLVDRYVHMHGLKSEISDERLRQVIDPLIYFIEDEILVFDLCIPILFTQLEFSNIDILPGVSIERIPDEYQLARRLLLESPPAIKEDILMAATHWLVLKNKELKDIPRNVSLWGQVAFDNTNLYPTEEFELFLAALRIVAQADAGYAQILVRPHLWAVQYRAALPPLTGTIYRKISSWFDNYPLFPKWYASVTGEQAIEIGRLFGKLFVSSSEPVISSAIRRLNYCYARDNVNDVVVDATIGLEALLGSGAEVRYKVSIRMAVVANILNKSMDAHDVFELTKKIYDFRSAVVHGRGVIEKTRKLKRIINGKEEILELGWIAVDLLGIAIQVVIDNPNLLPPENIDTYLIDFLRPKAQEQSAPLNKGNTE